jgi:hypothetical protein
MRLVLEHCLLPRGDTDEYIIDANCRFSINSSNTSDEQYRRFGGVVIAQA